MFGKRLALVAAVAAGAIFTRVGTVSADTIAVADLTQVGGVYTYTVTFDTDTKLTPSTSSGGDGFVIYNFDGYVPGSAVVVGAPVGFNVVVTNGGAASGPTGLADSSGVDLAAFALGAHIIPAASTDDINFIYNGSTTQSFPTGASFTVALTTTDKFKSETSYASVDNSVAHPSPVYDPSSGNPISSPASAGLPTPGAFLGGGLLFSLLGLLKIRKTSLSA